MSFKNSLINVGKSTYRKQETPEALEQDVSAS